MRLVLISDTHGLHDKVKVPEGDILIHAGDLTNVGKAIEIAEAGHWLRSLPHKHKVIIAGNHDWGFQKGLGYALNDLGDGITYLQDQEVTLDGVRIYGSPWQPEFCNWAFNVPRGKLKPIWDKIPTGLDVLVTHGPPRGVLDQSAPHLHSECLGDDELFTALEAGVDPKVHVFGHIHGGYGTRQFCIGTRFFNAAICDEAYRPVNKPWVVDLPSAQDQKFSGGNQQ
jgi:Icc-related predicted phosphoesterase